MNGVEIHIMTNATEHIMLTIAYKNGAGETLAASQSVAGDAHLCVETDEKSVDGAIVITCEPRSHLWVQLDAAIMPGEVYVPTGEMIWRIPTGRERDAYSPAVFMPGRHVVTARVMTANETRMRRNLACNPADVRGESDFYPHCTANAETRGEALFAARNVIDGYRVNSGHWGWPYQSWGIDGRTDAYCTVDFGREVEIDEAALVIRADFPHDAWWKSGRIEMSDGGAIDFELRKCADRQYISLGRHRVTWLRLQDLVQSPDDDGFPALTELEVYGVDIE